MFPPFPQNKVLGTRTFSVEDGVINKKCLFATKLPTLEEHKVFLLYELTFLQKQINFQKVFKIKLFLDKICLRLNVGPKSKFLGKLKNQTFFTKANLLYHEKKIHSRGSFCMKKNLLSNSKDLRQKRKSKSN